MSTQDSARILSRLEIIGVSTESTGSDDKNKFIKTNADGKLDPSFYDTDLETHLTSTSLHLTSTQNTLLDALNASATELNYSVGVTSSIQTQLDAASTHSASTSLHLSSQQNTWLDTLESLNTTPAWNAVALVSLNASELGSGTIPDARFPSTLPAISGVNLTALNATQLTSGTVPDARFPSTLPAVSGVNLTALNASNISSGTVPDTQFPSTLPAVSGVNLTALNASNISSGSLAIARLNGYPSNAAHKLKGDGSWNYDNNIVTTEAAGTTLALTHSDAIIRSTAVGATFTIPLNSAVAFQPGTVIRIINEAATGTMTISPTGGVTLNSPAGATTVTVRYGEAVLKKLSTDLWHLSGNLS